MRQDAHELSTLVRYAFVLRLVTILASLFAFSDRQLTVTTAVAITVLLGVGLVGLISASAPAILESHPILVALDAAVMTATMVAIGTDTPLVLVALSTSVIIGVTLPPVSAGLAGLVLVTGYVTATWASGGDSRSFTTLFSFPFTLVCVMGLCEVYRMLATRARRSEQALNHALTSAAASAERARLARELHDSTAKTLQGLSLSASSLDVWIDRDPPRAALVAHEIAEAADDAVQQLRELLSMLRQDDLALPFHKALCGMAADLCRRYDVELVTHIEPVDVSAPGARYELLAAAKEALMNALTHSGTTRIWLELRQLHGDVHLEVRDIGTGFDPSVLPDREREGHFGVRGFSERLALVGGHADVQTRAGEGTTVHFVLPGMVRSLA
ncbi:sensor histidine kinase [Nocardioides sp. Kera G14]|uniref:sensor histidine kinase n=1 Tax=Nocardioides sp. Kera G14 TaxID=2884264 RepID=UPI001D0F6E3C|nr:histidine kinase [Nocardioides sp. Kera G14]UDY25321.1 histidine kinase [Nocardioides sp. Kera G14]